MTADISSEAQRLKIVVVGHVDHGKSTLIGRIFFDTDALPEGKVEQIQRACELEGMPFEFAFLLDALLEEQEQNITIDTTRIPFRTAKRGYEIIDAPGHKEFLKNMITGAASADAAILLIAATEGVREQSRRHGYLLKLLGVKQVVVAVNKMDLVDYDEATFERVKAEYTDFLSQIGLTAERFVPISAREGDNIARRADAKMPWYSGDTILDTLDGFAAPTNLDDQPLRFVVQDVYRFDARRLIAGRIETGKLAIGDAITFQPGDRTAKIASFERWHGPDRDFAVASESITITLDEQLFLERGHIGTSIPGSAGGTPALPGISVANRFNASLFWMGGANLSVGESVRLKLATQETTARIAAISRVLDSSTLETVAGGRNYVAKNDVAEVTIETDKPVAFDLHDHVPTLGRFVLVHERRVAGGGIITELASEQRATNSDRIGTRPASGVLPLTIDEDSPVATNIVWSDTKVSAGERTVKNGHRGAILWLTGLSGSGKSTIASTVNRALFERGYQAMVLDGDNLRHGLCADLGFTQEDRSENTRRAAHVARLFAENGFVVLTAFISPTRADRQAAREIAEGGGIPFVEIFTQASLEACEQRDPKGLYKRARAGEIPQFTGIDAPYEVPDAPDMTISTETQTIEQAAEELLRVVQKTVKKNNSV
ncbi:MAG: adenylyl-sulfate kinase [Akkermansiaceae bacterium]|nr:adenylyl-sulfate kinase [Armatimonadota bacterium]